MKKRINRRREEELEEKWKSRAAAKKERRRQSQGQWLMRRREENVENDPGAENNIKGARKKSIWASKPIAQAQDLLGPFEFYTRASRVFTELNEQFLFLKLNLISCCVNLFKLNYILNICIIWYCVIYRKPKKILWFIYVFI